MLQPENFIHKGKGQKKEVVKIQVLSKTLVDFSEVFNKCCYNKLGTLSILYWHSNTFSMKFCILHWRIYVATCLTVCMYII